MINKTLVQALLILNATCGNCGSLKQVISMDELFIMIVKQAKFHPFSILKL